MELLLVNGPNLNLLGKRDVEIYGKLDFESLVVEIGQYVEEKGDKFESFQSNHEGDIIDVLQSKGFAKDGIIINPGAFTHYSYAISDALGMLKCPIIEVHISNIHKREEFRHKSITASQCSGQIVGFGVLGYFLAVDALRKIVKRRK